MAYIGNSPANVGNYQIVDDIASSFNGTTTTFALTVSSQAINPAKSGQLLVGINGVLQEPDDTGTDGFKVSGSNIVFSSAPASGSAFWCVYQGQNVDIGTPSDGTVGTAQMSYPLGNFSSTGIDDNATSNAITIDSSENVGIGTSSPSGTLEVEGSNAGLHLVLSHASGASYSAIGQDSSDNLRIYTGTNESMRIDAGGDVKVNTGNLIIGTSGKGIDFSSTSDGSGTMTSEVLDDYEEGTWTPTLKGTSGEATYAWQYGQYTKVGKQVTIVGRIGLSGKGTMSGDTRIGGLPFNIDNTLGSGYMAGLNIFRTYTASLTNIESINESNNISIKLFNGGDNSNLDTTEIGASQRFFFSMTYMAT